MAGRGFAPKDPSKKAGHSKDHTPSTVIRQLKAGQPPLPDGMEWHPRTVAWWQMWADAPQSAEFMATDWDFLLDTAIMHTALWSKGQWTLAQEIRLRVAKFGATPEDRQRLRWHFADDDAEAEAPKPAASGRWGDLQLVDPPKAVGQE